LKNIYLKIRIAPFNMCSNILRPTGAAIEYQACNGTWELWNSIKTHTETTGR